MSYDEHLISMAGGDGDMLEAIQRHGAILTEWEQFLLDKVREQAAKLAAVREVHKAKHSPAETWAAGYKWRGHHCTHDGQHWPCETIAALEPTP